MSNADHDAYARLRNLFEHCADMAPGEREAWLEREAIDTTTRIELEIMLAADANGGGLLRREVVDLIERLDEPADEFDAGGLVGRRYGAFQLVRLIGRGGQGTVYEAARVEGDFAQTVAVKLLRRGIHDPHEHRRFRRERDILARFDDPGIARLIDGGVSAEGVPYLIMDFVDGEPLDRWCERRPTDLATRLALFERVCGIVAAAHRALIVHRDLKPANVLVTADGTVKVLDFGIARLLDEDDALTHTLVPLMTPGYGAPEQLDGGAITLATDVHALGVILRQLVTGRSPQDADAGATPPPELHWIIAKATATEPERRYRDAAELRDDVVRYRTARPLIAHPPSRLYFARKFVRRHRGGVLATMLFVVGVLASAGVALWQAKVAREQGARAASEAERAKAALARAETVRDFVVEVFETGGSGLPRDQLPDTATLLERGRSAALAGGSRAPETRADMLSMLGRIYLGLQREDRALELVNEALAILQKQVPRNDEAYAVALARRGELHGRLGHGEEARKDFDAALALQAARDPEGLDVARTLIARGEQRAANAEVAEGVRDYERALAIEAKHADAPVALRAQTLNGYGIALWRAGDCAGGEAPLREAVALSRQAWGDDHAETAGALSGLSLCLTQQLKFAESEAVSRESLAILAHIYGADHPALGQAKNNLANLLARVGKLGEAEPLLRQKLAADHETGVDEAGSGLNTWINLANLLRNRGDLDGSQVASLTAQRIARRIAPDAAVGHEPDLLLAHLALARSDLAAAQSGIDAYRRWQATPQGAQAMLPARIDFLEARIALQRRDLAAAEPLVARGLETVERLGCTDGARGYIVAADLRQAQGRDDEAGALLDSAAALCERLGTPRHFAYGEALLARAEWRLRHADRQGADDDARLADVALAAELPPEHDKRLRLAALRSRLR